MCVLLSVWKKAVLLHPLSGTKRCSMSRLWGRCGLWSCRCQSSGFVFHFWFPVYSGEKSSENIWMISDKVLIFAAAFLSCRVRDIRKRKLIEMLMNEGKVVQDKQSVCCCFRWQPDARKPSRFRKGITSAIRPDTDRDPWALLMVWRYILQWRVWSWLRMNASYRLNTCKSRGIGGVAIRQPATGGRVSNAYPTFPVFGASLSKERLIPGAAVFSHVDTAKGFIRYRMGVRPISQLAG